MQKYSEQEKYGFRIVGMKVYKNDFKTFQLYDKSFGKKLKTHQAIIEGETCFTQLLLWSYNNYSG